MVRGCVRETRNEIMALEELREYNSRRCVCVCVCVCVHVELGRLSWWEAWNWLCVQCGI